MEKNQIIQRYIETVLEHGEPPGSVYRFAKDLDISEREFFGQFASFEALEAGIWRDLTRATIEAISSGEEWTDFSAHHRLLTFYYAYFEKVLDHRSFFLVRFPRPSRQPLQTPPSQLRLMHDEFCDFARRIIATGVDRGELPCRGKVAHTYPGAMFLHFLSAIDFNLRDDSQGFERTDAYIEKSVKLGFDLIGTSALDSAVDLVRFLSGRTWGKDQQPSA